jgi:hypothetical protein
MKGILVTEKGEYQINFPWDEIVVLKTTVEAEIHNRKTFFPDGKIGENEFGLTDEDFQKDMIDLKSAYEKLEFIINLRGGHNDNT